MVLLWPMMWLLAGVHASAVSFFSAFTGIERWQHQGRADKLIESDHGMLSLFPVTYGRQVCGSMNKVGKEACPEIMPIICLTAPH